MLSLHNINLSRGKRKILDGLTAEAGAGEITMLLGGNGVGKTTLLGFLGGLLRADSGMLSLEGETISPESDSWNRRLSYVLDDGGTIPLLTVAEQLQLQCLLNGADKAEAEERSSELISLLELTEYRDYRADELSAGFQKKVGIGLGIIRDADLYLFDEPFSSLDYVSANALKSLLKLLRDRGRTVIVTTHSPAILSGLCSRIWMLSDGKTEQYTDPQEINELIAAADAGGDDRSFASKLSWLGPL